MSTIYLSYVCVQHVVDRCVSSVERYMYVQQSKHMCVCISLLCLLYLCHMCVRSTMSTGAIYISHVSYTSTHESGLLYIYILVMSLTRLHMSHVSYTCMRESRLLYIYIWVMSFIHLYMSRVSYTFTYESCPLYIYIWVVSLTHLYMSHVSYTSIHESCRVRFPPLVRSQCVITQKPQVVMIDCDAIYERTQSNQMFLSDSCPS
jgi:hypothetical protein